MKISKNTWVLLFTILPLVLVGISYQTKSILVTKIITAVLIIIVLFSLYVYKKIKIDNVKEESHSSGRSTLILLIILGLMIVAFIFQPKM